MSPAIAPVRMLGRPKLKWVAATILVLLAAGVVSTQVALLWAKRITHGSVSWSPGLLGECRQFEPRSETSHCAAVAFAPGDPVGIGFSVRNTGLLPLTVVSVTSFGTESDHTLAEMHPVLPPEGETFAVERTRPFEPITLRSGEEATIQLIGEMRSCDAVRGYWTPGVGARFEGVRLTVRWLLISTDIQIPLQQALQIDGLVEGQCP